MKCEIVIRNINQYFNEEHGQLDSETRQHLPSCKECNVYYANQKYAAEVVKRIAGFEPGINDPAGLTEDIMAGLSDPQGSTGTANRNGILDIFKNVHFRRALSSAAVILFALFCFEQYLVLDKINRLEAHVQKASANKTSMKKLQVYNAWQSPIIRELYHGKEFSPLVRKYIAILKKRSP